jgi:hypothetical protein
MSTTSVPTAEAPVDEAVVGCAVCPHPLTAHDAISLRFCRATAAHTGDTTTRGCVCPSS